MSYYSKQIESAAHIKCCIPNPAFTIAMALWCTGLESDKAFDTSMQERTSAIANSIENKIVSSSSIENKKERAKIMCYFAIRVPSKIHKNPLFPSTTELLQKGPKGPHEMKSSISLTDYCRLVGFDESLLAGTSRPAYMAIFNFKRALDNGQTDPITFTAIQRYADRRVRAEIQEPRHLYVSDIDDTRISLPRPPSAQDRPSRSALSSINIENQDDVSVLLSPSGSRNSRLSNESSTTTNTSLASKPTSSSGSSSFSSKVNEIGSRLTSQAASRSRADNNAWKRCEESAHILGTQMYDWVKSGKLPLTKFKSADSVAEFINSGFELDVISGREILDAVAKGRVGVAPPKKGRTMILPDDDLQDLISLVFTANSIDQANCAPNRLKRKELTSIVGNIVNTMRKEAGTLELSDVALFRHVQKALDTKCVLNITDKRELLRLIWLTYEQQQKHYINWEMHLIMLEFGREPIDENERLREGNVVFYENALRRMIHIDEMGFHFDGSKNGIGGRVSLTYSDPNLPDPGEAIAKSSDKVSVLFGATYDGQAIPPMFVFPNKAKNPKLKLIMLQLLHQIEGHFGYTGKRFFNPVVAFSENGSVDKDIFKAWYREVVCVLYPDIADVPGKRVLAKSDGGPGRTDLGYLAESNLDGLIHYPGLPNGTMFQELDNVFSFTKSLMEENRSRIFDKNYELYGPKAKVQFEDISYILFGGDKEFRDGTRLILKNAFAMSLNQEHLTSAQEKCGYVPATRIALESGKLRHELVIDRNGDVDQDSNDLGIAAMLLKLEKENHEAVHRLQLKGYNIATILKRDLERNNRQSDAFQETITIPGTTEHQRRLMKASTQGKHFQVTNGGAPMNSDDCLIAAEMKAYEREKVDLCKKKKAIKAQRKLKVCASMVQGNDYLKWGVNALKAKIRMADPNVKTTTFAGRKKDELQELWINKYSKMNPTTDQHRWTVVDEKRLKLITEGKIESLDKTGIYKRAIKSRFEWFEVRLSNISNRHALALAMKVLQDNFDSLEDATDFIATEFQRESILHFIDDDAESAGSDDDDSYFSSDDDDSDDDEPPLTRTRKPGIPKNSNTQKIPRRRRAKAATDSDSSNSSDDESKAGEMSYEKSGNESEDDESSSDEDSSTELSSSKDDPDSIALSSAAANSAAEDDSSDDDAPLTRTRKPGTPKNSNTQKIPRRRRAKAATDSDIEISGNSSDDESKARESDESKDDESSSDEDSPTELSSSKDDPDSIAPELAHIPSAAANSAAEDDSTANPLAIANLRYKELQKLCKDYGLGAKGAKEVLAAKILKHIGTNDV